MDYTNERNVINLDVLILTPDEYKAYNEIFRKIIKTHNPDLKDIFIRDIDRIIMTDSINRAEFIVKTVQQDKDFKNSEIGRVKTKNQGEHDINKDQFLSQ